MSLTPPERIWWKPLGWQEKIWLYIAVVWGIILFLMMFVWSAAGRQDTPVETYRTNPAQFQQIANAHNAKYQIGTDKGIPIVRPPENGEVYIVARVFQWSPMLELKKGATYRLHVSSLDFQHGLSIQPVNLNFQVLPGYDYVITLTPTESGEFYMVCNEYCGAGHHNMVGKIIVRE